MQLEDIRAQSIFKSLRFKILLDGMLNTYDMIYTQGMLTLKELKI